MFAGVQIRLFGGQSISESSARFFALNKSFECLEPWPEASSCMKINSDFCFVP